MRVRGDGAFPGEVGWAGAAETFWLADPVRGRSVILMTQHMPPTAYPLRAEVGTAAGVP